MGLAYLVCGVLPLALPASAQSASTYAGATFTEYQSYFPDPSQVGNAGPTATGAEPEAIATASVAAENNMGLNLTTSDLYAMQQLCAYETVALGYSRFCELFTEEEWRRHDTCMADIIVALNFTTMAANGPLPIARIPEYQTYHVHDIAPFASHLVGQVLSCPASRLTSTSTPRSNAPYVCFLLNDDVVSLTGISHCETPDPNGLCLLDDFVHGMQERIAEVVRFS